MASGQASGQASTSIAKAMRTLPAATRATCRCAEMESSGVLSGSSWLAGQTAAFPRTRRTSGSRQNAASASLLSGSEEPLPCSWRTEKRQTRTGSPSSKPTPCGR
eukprot:4463636-Alexandrium_andersonii.AAC.1